MILLLALDLAVIPDTQSLSTDHVLEKTQSSERGTLIVEDLQQSFSLKGS